MWTYVFPKKEDGTYEMAHDSRFKCCVTTQAWEKVDRVPAWTRYARQNPQNLLFEAVFWNPITPYEWKS